MNNLDEMFSFDDLRNLTIGTVESVSPAKIEILLETNAPQNTAINTGIPVQFPKINGYVLIPNEAGALIGQITWIGVFYSGYPKRKGFKDFELIDLPFPLRKMSLAPLGLLKKRNDNKYEVDRGVYTYPSVGDTVIIPSQEQLTAIAENNEEGAYVKIGTCPLAGNTPVRVNPNKLFGRHTAVLGNTGSGKSCSVAGLIRWSLEEAEKNKKGDQLNSRFIILDPNGEYLNSFNDLGGKVRRYQIMMDSTKKDESENNDVKKESKCKQLSVPAWMWNSYEWSSLTQATGKTQRPLLRRALKELKNRLEIQGEDISVEVYSFYSSLRVSLKNRLKSAPASIADFPGKQNTGDLIKVSSDATIDFLSKNNVESLKAVLVSIDNTIKGVLRQHPKSSTGYYPAFSIVSIKNILIEIEKLASIYGSIEAFEGPDEDSPVFYEINDLPIHLNRLADEQGMLQFIDFLTMRIRSLVSDTRIKSVISCNESYTLEKWLTDYIGSNNAENGYISIIDLSLVPQEIIHLVISIISRIIFEAIQRFRKINCQEIPTVLVLEEAHTFIKKYNDGSEEISPAKLCCQTFERIAREGRKFGLGLILSSQRPSELSATVLSQCNTFLLHRIVNDEDQRLVRKLVPDNMGGLLDELPVLPSRQAILTGWASPIPVLVEMNYLPEAQQPNSHDPDFWKVWIGETPLEIDWRRVADDWQCTTNKKNQIEQSEIE